MEWGKARELWNMIAEEYNHLHASVSALTILDIKYLFIYLLWAPGKVHTVCNRQCMSVKLNRKRLYFVFPWLCVYFHLVFLIFFCKVSSKFQCILVILSETKYGIYLSFIILSLVHKGQRSISLNAHFWL